MFKVQNSPATLRAHLFTDGFHTISKPIRQPGLASDQRGITYLTGNFYLNFSQSQDLQHSYWSFTLEAEPICMRIKTRGEVALGVCHTPNIACTVTTLHLLC